MNLPFSQDAAYRFDSLYQWLNRKYRLEQVELSIAGEGYRIFKIQNIDEVLELALKESSRPDEHAPYWAELWPSALALAQFLSREVNLAGRTALELGSGLGLVGIVAHRCGAEVLLSDLEDDALRMAELNWIINFGELPGMVRLDWRNPALNRQFETLLAADLAYEKRLFWPLIDAFGKLLAPGGEIWLSEPNRPIAVDFFELLKKEGFEWEKFTETVEFEQRKVDISVYRIDILSAF